MDQNVWTYGCGNCGAPENGPFSVAVTKLGEDEKSITYSSSCGLCGYGDTWTVTKED